MSSSTAAPSHPVRAPQQGIATRMLAGLNGNPILILSAILTLYLAITCIQAAHKLLWADELFTLAIARQGSLHAIWEALAAGADPNPPLSHWLVLQSTRLFGLSALAIRIPSILCVFAALCALWTVLRRWLTPSYAAVGLLAFMTTRGFDHAYNARSYAPLLAFSLAALAFWLHSFDPTRRAVAVAICLALAISSNYYGVLALLPIAAGEAAYSIHTHRLRPAIWLALAAGALPLLAYRPLIRHQLAEFGPHAWNRPHPDMLSDSYLVLVEGLFWPVFGLAVYTIWKRRTSTAPHTTRLAPHELTALAVLLLYPILGYALAVLGHGIISPRCIIPVCGGFAIAAALLAARTFGPSPRAALILLATALLWVVGREAACFIVLAHQRTAFFAVRDRIVRLAQADPTQPILISDSLLVLPLAHYAPDLQPRLIFPIDFAAIHASEPDDSGEQNLWAGRNGIFPVRIVPYRRDLLPQAFVLLSRPRGWLPTRLATDGYLISAPESPAPLPDLGGVFTPLCHSETRVLIGRSNLLVGRSSPLLPVEVRSNFFPRHPPEMLHPVYNQH
ncbi:MAG TPA: glycosyltransferase family 39 protein [Acidobacteriaceae bacterium]|nr:glycosyltransferase family 39 protein [Acidobacteriaceae bacterium]